MKIDPKRIVFAPKRSKVGVDQHNLRKTLRELEAIYRAEGKDPAPLFASHYAQEAAIASYRKAFPDSLFLSREELVPELLSAENCDLVVSLGGDNHFTYVARFVSGVPILGINSDPSRSVGALLNIAFKDPLALLSVISEGRLVVEQWPRIEASINNKVVATAVNDVFIGEESRLNMSRHRLLLSGVEEEQRGSGLLTTTGAGSTGWYSSAGRVLDLKPFPRTLPEMRYLLTEPAYREEQPYRFRYGNVTGNGSISVISLNDDEGILAVDSIESFPLTRGMEATLRLSTESLQVVAVR